VHLPNFGAFGDAAVLADLAVAAEGAGWDGFFLWDHLLFCEFDKNAHVDPWVALTAAAAATSSIMIGPLVTPLARRRPWELARQTVSLQNFSQGRLILGVGLGEPTEWDFRFFGDPTDPLIRAEKLDEGLAILKGLWSGDQFAFAGTHYTLEPMTFLPVPVTPVPIWVGGAWPHRRPFRRAARYQGVMPLGGADDGIDVLQQMVDYVRAHRESDEPFDVVVSGRSEHDDASAQRIASFEGLATWWIEDISPLRFGVDWPALADPWDVDALRARILAGPVRPSGATGPLLHMTTAESVAASRIILNEERRALAEAGVHGELTLTGGSSIPDLLTKGDIDLHLRVTAAKFADAVAGLRGMSDRYQIVHPEIWTPWLAAFERVSGPPVGIAITVVGSEHDRRFVNSWERLGADPAARREYNALKRRAPDYETEKSAFFDRIGVEWTGQPG
jgi:alkanesulfonate monooxygenase SsuD/methylene tetrahydromethanopterin reductase-like flavin-dependent oxidoreductase (luciferase family)/GrpB-like predicted nucleotidyltransferase (UPF0157 family)